MALIPIFWGQDFRYMALQNGGWCSCGDHFSTSAQSDTELMELNADETRTLIQGGETAAIGVRYLITRKLECLVHIVLITVLVAWISPCCWTSKRYFVAADSECGSLCSGEELLSPSRYCGGFERTELCDWQWLILSYLSHNVDFGGFWASPYSWE